MQPTCALVALLGLNGTTMGQLSAAEAPSWKALEVPFLTAHVQLTAREQFVRAGEAYFSPDMRWIVFQAVAAPVPGQQPDPFYAMFAARLTGPHGTSGGLGMEETIRISPPGSANTCGWFHPTEPGRILFGSTLVQPSEHQRSGFQVGARKYVWMFPAEMEVVTRLVPEVWADMERSAGREPTTTVAPPDAHGPVPVFSRPDYDAECSYSRDGRFILYSHVRETRREDRADADIFVYDTKTGSHTPLVVADGYDGGPFFSPDMTRICYRSDRNGDDLLQIFIADLKFGKDADGAPVPIGIEKEHQLTDNGHVNWAPFWHPSGRFLVYGTSEHGHQNYEVVAITADPERIRAAPAAGLARVRITHAPGADVLPAFSPDGRLMMWTSQRGPAAPGEDRPSSQLWVAEVDADAIDAAAR